MKLAILGSRGIHSKYSGYETFAEEISIHLVGKGIEVTVYCERTGEFNESDFYKGVKLRYVDLPDYLGPLKRVGFDAICLWKARSVYDVVYMLGTGASIFCFIPRLWGKTVWINTDGIEWARSKFTPLQKFAAKLMELFSMITPTNIIADAHAIKDHLQQRYRRIPKCTVIPHGAYIVDQADPTVLRQWELLPYQYYLVVCRLEPENHVLEIIRGYIASDSSLPLVIVGNHQSGSAYVQRLLNNLDARLRFVGTVFDKEKLSSLRFHARACFHGHSVGGTSPTLLEALGCHNAVIALDNVFNREVAGNAAKYFKTESDIPNILEELNEGSELQEMRSRAVEIIKEKYTWEIICQQYLDLLNSTPSRN